TSVVLTRILLAERFGCEPVIVPMQAHLDAMLSEADAALIIGDPALLLDPVVLRRRYEVLDLGEEWTAYTAYPMVFAVWAGKALPLGSDDLFAASCRHGLAHIDEIVDRECPRRHVDRALGRKYLSEHIVFELNERDREGMRIYLQFALQLDNLKLSGNVT